MDHLTFENWTALYAVRDGRMGVQKVKRIIAVLAFLLSIAIVLPLMASQVTPPPKSSLAFDVASIKPVAPPFPTGGGPWVVTHGRFRAEVGYVRGMVSFAYNLMPTQVKGGPDWLDREPYFVDARAEDPEAGPDQIRLMMLTLLKERFKLADRKSVV